MDPSSAAYGSNFTVAATGGASGNAVVFTSAGVLHQLGRDLHHDQRHWQLLVNAQPGGNTNYAAATQVTETASAALA